MKQSKNFLTLNQLLVGESARILDLNLPQATKLKLLSYGLAPKDYIEVVAKTPLRGPISIQTIQKERIALRYEQAALINVDREAHS